MGKRCQVLGLPSLACPWHWEGLWHSAPFLLPRRGQWQFYGPSKRDKGWGVGEATLSSEDEA